MKKGSIKSILFFFLALISVSCNDYLGILPKGEKIPTSYADFEALLRDEYSVHNVAITQATILLNDRFVSASNLNYYKLWDINYNWKESEDRKQFNNSDEGAYYQSYASIATCNLIIENGDKLTESTETQRKELLATARVLRAISYFTLINYYAASYDPATAASLKGVPLILSADIGAAHRQISIQEMYDFMISEINMALPDLQEQGLTILHPAKGAAYALLARIYLQMDKYAQALENAERALTINNRLFDWTAYYQSNSAQIEDPTNYALKQSPMNHGYIENYYFRHGESVFSTTEKALRVDRAARFEQGDAKFAARWKLRTVGVDTYYTSTMTGFHNTQGLTSVEAYLIKAECLVRLNRLTEALEVLNRVRKTRILADFYAELHTTDKVQAIKWIQQTKRNELIFSIIPFADSRRLNREEMFGEGLQKVENGQTLSLSPSSHLWIMPFPLGAIENPGNGVIEQNVEK